MGGNLGGAAGGGDLCRARVWLATGCAFISGRGTAPLEIVGFLGWQGFAPLELTAAPLEVGDRPTCPYCHFCGPSDL